MPRDGGWRLVPRLLLRRAGFPFALLDELACPQTSEWAAAAAGARADAEAARAVLLRVLFPAEVEAARARSDRAALRALSRWRKRVGARAAGPPPGGAWSDALLAGHDAWTSALARAADARDKGEHVARDEVAWARSSLRRLTGRADVREALFLLSPDLGEAVGDRLTDAPSAAPGARERALERRLYAFAQRLAGKNETTSFFGPLTYGDVDDAAADVSFGPELAGGVARREAFVAFWAAAEVARAAARDPSVRRALPLRRVPAVSIERGGARDARGRHVPLDEAARAVLAASDGARDATALAAATGVAPDDVAAAIARLERAGLARRDLEPSSTTAYPLRDVAERLPQGATPWRALVHDLEAAAAEFARVRGPRRRGVLNAAEERFAGATGVSPRRASGRMYADRTILFEDCLGDGHPFVVPRRDADALARALAPALDLGATFGGRVQRAVRALARAVWDDARRPLPYLEFARRLDERVGRGELVERLGPARALVSELEARVVAASDGRVARLAPDDVADLLDVPAGPLFASPDVMLAHTPAGIVPVLGEVHPYVFAWGLQGHFAPDPGALQDAFRADLRPWGGAERMATVVARRRHKGLVADSFPGRFVEVTGRAGPDASRRVAIGDVVVDDRGEGVRLYAPDGELTLYVGENDHPHLRAFAPPAIEVPRLRTGEHTPRVVLGDLVLQRERWVVGEPAAAALAAARGVLDVAIEVAAARREHGWPRFVFAHAPGEPKPMCLDLESPFAHELLRALLARGDVVLVEMLPGPDALWLERSSGAHTSELRIAAIREP